ncbi:hypothetical protein LXA43DRAFT_1053369 [Ganoderma leucocontextum]|nr:hypothetical protein LXA43DRAFT_1053369 [Ganoderma leucocontextum]
MKLALEALSPSLFFFALAPRGARAQFANYGIPSCATGCMEQAAIQGRCGFADMACICKALSDASVMQTAVTCERNSCPKTQTQTQAGEGPGREAAAFEQFFDGFCQG